MTTALLLPILLLPLTPPPCCSEGPSVRPPQVVVDSDAAFAGGYEIVRMRKLHLVRPELIPYPLAYEVYC